MCMGNELFFCLLYIMYYIEEPQGENQQALSDCLALLFSFASFIHWSSVELICTHYIKVKAHKLHLTKILVASYFLMTSLVLSSVAAMAAGSLCRGLSTEVWHKSPPPHHRLPQHGCHRRGWPWERAEQSTVMDERIHKPRKQRRRQSEDDEQKKSYENIGKYRWGWDHGNQSRDLAKPHWEFIFIWI